MTRQAAAVVVVMNPYAHILSYFEKNENVKIGHVVLGKEWLDTKRPVVIINGATLALYDWSALADELAKSRPGECLCLCL